MITNVIKDYRLYYISSTRLVSEESRVAVQ